jgi:hypothetical protein
MNDSMKDLDDELTNALRREEPPAGFADRVLSRVAEHPENAQMWGPPLGGPIRLKPDPTSVSRPASVETVSTRTRLSFTHWAAAAALVAAVAGGFDYVAKQKERAEGEAATARVVLGLQIAGTKLQLVQTKISRLHEPPENNSNR